MSLAKSGINPSATLIILFLQRLVLQIRIPFFSQSRWHEDRLPESAAALDVSRACASGLQAIISAGQQVQSGHSKLALAAGAEMPSRAPYAVTTSRWGNAKVISSLKIFLSGVIGAHSAPSNMGDTAENLAEKYRMKGRVDEYAVTSQSRALAAIESDFFKRLFSLPLLKGSRQKFLKLTRRQGPHYAGRLAKLKPAFQEGGKVTAGNSSGVTDGAAALIVGDKDGFTLQGVTPEARC